MNNILEKDIFGSISKEKYICTVICRNGKLVMDEPNNVGGQDKGIDPYSTLLASLAGCTLSTLRMYIDRKGWDIPEISVQLNMYQETKIELTTFIRRIISFSESVSNEQNERLLVIAKNALFQKF